MELMEESLTVFLEHTAVSLPFHIQVNITHDIALALAYLHSNNILHRDLSSNNILLNAGCKAKVTDFGMTKIVETNPRMTCSKITQCPGTPVFMPPEAVRAKPRYSDKLDMFSLGVLVIQIITCTFPAPTDAEIVVEHPSEPTKIIVVPELERRKKDINKVPSGHFLLPIVHHCIKDRDKERPTAAQLCQSLVQLKVGEVYKSSVAEKQSKASLEQQLRVKEEEQAAEIAQLQEQMRQLATEQESKEREIADLKFQLETSEKKSARKEKMPMSLFGFFSKKKSGEKASDDRIEEQRVGRVSKPEANVSNA